MIVTAKCMQAAWIAALPIRAPIQSRAIARTVRVRWMLTADIPNLPSCRETSSLHSGGPSLARLRLLCQLLEAHVVRLSRPEERNLLEHDHGARYGQLRRA